METEKYEPYGATLQGGSSRYEFTGQERDEEISLDYFDARYYSFSKGIFIEPDPILQDPSNPQNINPYAYVRNSPVIRTDPNGKESGVASQPFTVSFLPDIVRFDHTVVVVGNERDYSSTEGNYVTYSYSHTEGETAIPGFSYQGKLTVERYDTRDQLVQALGRQGYDEMVMLDTSPSQEAAIRSYGESVGSSCSSYSVDGNNCNVFAVNALSAGGVPVSPSITSTGVKWDLKGAGATSERIQQTSSSRRGGGGYSSSPRKTINSGSHYSGNTGWRHKVTGRTSSVRFK